VAIVLAIYNNVMHVINHTGMFHNQLCCLSGNSSRLYHQMISKYLYNLFLFVEYIHMVSFAGFSNLLVLFTLATVFMY